MTYNEFLVLTQLEKTGKYISQREISKLTDLSLGTINNIIIKFKNQNYINKNNIITKTGLEALKPYRVKRALFLAAGFGSRLVPITLNTPKPLVKVHGKRIIETLLDAVIAAQIEEIIIVTGYLSEQFELLKKKYPTIKILYNDKYNETNNISSAYLVKEKIANAYVLESDLFLYNPDLIRKYEYQSNFLGKYVEVTDDWCFETSNKVITKEKIGGYNCYQMCGISYFEEKYAKKIEKDLEEVFNSPGGKEKYWEQVVLDVCKKNYKIVVREYNEGDVIEIDTFGELKAIDKTYDI